MSETQITPAEVPTEKKPDIFHYFLVSGEVEFLDSKFNKSPKYLKVNSIFKGTGVGIIAKDLGAIQTRLQMAFHQKYSRSHKEPPHEITDCVITACSFLGTHTDEEFMAGAPSKTPAPNPETVKKILENPDVEKPVNP